MSKQNAPQFTRKIPKFLQQYSHMLNINKKNYMGEEVGQYDEADEYDEISKRELASATSSSRMKELDSQSDHIDEEPIPVQDPVSKPLVSDKLDTKINIEPPPCGDSDTIDENGKLFFKKRKLNKTVTSTTISVESDETRDTTSEKKAKKLPDDSKLGKANKKLLSFGDD